MPTILRVIRGIALVALAVVFMTLGVFYGQSRSRGPELLADPNAVLEGRPGLDTTCLGSTVLATEDYFLDERHVYPIGPPGGLAIDLGPLPGGGQSNYECLANLWVQRFDVDGDQHSDVFWILSRDPSGDIFATSLQPLPRPADSPWWVWVALTTGAITMIYAATPAAISTIVERRRNNRDASAAINQSTLGETPESAAPSGDIAAGPSCAPT